MSADEWRGLPDDDPRRETNSFTLERAAIQLFRAQQLLAEDYDRSWKDDDTDENWQTLLVEAERDRYREVALGFMVRAGLRGVGVMSESNRHIQAVPEDPQPATLDDLLPVALRIADALEAQVRPTDCGEIHTSSAKCVLDDRHVGHHVTADGRYHWLDEN